MPEPKVQTLEKLGFILVLLMALLAYQAQATDKAVLKNLATFVYLMLTFGALYVFVRKQSLAPKHQAMSINVMNPP